MKKIIGWSGLVAVVVGLSYMSAAGDYFGYTWMALFVGLFTFAAAIVCAAVVFFFLWLILD